MEPSPVSVERWESNTRSSSSVSVPQTGTGFTHIKRAFFGDLAEVRRVDASELTGRRHSVSRSQSHEMPSPKIQIPSSDDISERDPIRCTLEKVVLPQKYEKEYEIEEEEEEEILVMPSTESQRRIVRFYSGVAASALGGAVLAGFVKQSLGSLIRFMGSGVVMIQLLSVLGYADVRWRKLLSDVWVLGRRTPEIHVVHSVFSKVRESAVLKMAFVGGVLGGLFLP
ncbi:uncharacterized protein TM35_000072050 [Trypanosoma theileri]|uniref:FUN14 family protein n=1 Tax=Trypanosoma theileri TaxID=67003 RepID=A0A1X0P1R7_9TRYP|nr:uncharacterized protein TM35_000072050 [Trypanosoma theileri]ORC90781.1 hypothetical protein TM35_000072050 [Trypanosoma theileri]